MILSVWCPALCGLALSTVVAAEISAPGLRLLPPSPQARGPIHVVVTTNDDTPLPVARASGITVLGTTNLALASARWPRLPGRQTFSDGALRVEHDPGTDPRSPWFFVALESPLAPAITVSNAAGLRAAVTAAQPGTRILLAPGTYPGGFFFANLRGATNLPIVIAAADPRDPPVIRGGSNGIQLTDPEFVELHDLVFSGAAGNGLNIDDGGSFATPARHLVLRGLRIADVGPLGNRDGIKLSGVVDFRVEDCIVERWGPGGSAVDMVGCHRGVIESNLFRHNPATASTGANGVQTKGGTRDVVVRRNRFEHAGARAVNVGGSTGLEFFRPPLTPGDEHAEAKDIRVEGNTFLGSTAPVAFVGVDGAVVRFNTIYLPERWALRILQETTASGFVPCREGQFTDNLIALHSSLWASGGVNVGPDTAPATFQFSRNWWYCVDDPTRSRPSLPTLETAGVHGQSPRFRDAANGDLRQAPESPARLMGADALTE